MARKVKSIRTRLYDLEQSRLASVRRLQKKCASISYIPHRGSQDGASRLMAQLVQNRPFKEEGQRSTSACLIASAYLNAH